MQGFLSDLKSEHCPSSRDKYAFEAYLIKNNPDLLECPRFFCKCVLLMFDGNKALARRTDPRNKLQRAPAVTIYDILQMIGKMWKPHHWNNIDFVLEVVGQIGWMAMPLISDRLKNSLLYMLEIVGVDGLTMAWAGRAVREDFSCGYAAVANDGDALQYLDRSLQVNPAIFYKAATNGCSFCDVYISPNHFQSPAACKALVTANGALLEFVPERIKNQKDIILAAVRKWGESLQFAPDQWQDDTGVVTAAVTQNGAALQYATPRHWSAKPVVNLAIETFPAALCLAPKDLQMDPDIYKKAVERGPADVLSKISLEARDNAELAMMVFMSAPREPLDDDDYDHVPLATHFKDCDNVLKSPDVAREAVNQDPRNITMFVKEAVSRELWKTAVDLYPYIILYVEDDALRQELAPDAVRKEPNLLLHFEEQDFSKAVYEAAVKKVPEAIAIIPPEIKKDRAIVLAAIKQLPQLVNMLDPACLNHREVVFSALAVVLFNRKVPDFLNDYFKSECNKLGIDNLVYVMCQYNVYKQLWIKEAWLAGSTLRMIYQSLVKPWSVATRHLFSDAQNDAVGMFFRCMVALPGRACQTRIPGSCTTKRRRLNFGESIKRPPALPYDMMLRIAGMTTRDSFQTFHFE